MIFTAREIFKMALRIVKFQGFFQKLFIEGDIYSEGNNENQKGITARSEQLFRHIFCWPLN